MNLLMHKAAEDFTKERKGDFDWEEDMDSMVTDEASTATTDIVLLPKGWRAMRLASMVREIFFKDVVSCWPEAHEDTVILVADVVGRRFIQQNGHIEMDDFINADGVLHGRFDDAADMTKQILEQTKSILPVHVQQDSKDLDTVILTMWSTAFQAIERALVTSNMALSA